MLNDPGAGHVEGIVELPRFSSLPQTMAQIIGSVVVTRKIPRPGLVGSSSNSNSEAATSEKGRTSASTAPEEQAAANKASPTEPSDISERLRSESAPHHNHGEEGENQVDGKHLSLSPMQVQSGGKHLHDRQAQGGDRREKRGDARQSGNDQSECSKILSYPNQTNGPGRELFDPRHPLGQFLLRPQAFIMPAARNAAANNHCNTQRNVSIVEPSRGQQRDRGATYSCAPAIKRFSWAAA